MNSSILEQPKVYTSVRYLSQALWRLPCAGQSVRIAAVQLIGSLLPCGRCARGPGVRRVVAGRSNPTRLEVNKARHIFSAMCKNALSSSQMYLRQRSEKAAATPTIKVSHFVLHLFIRTTKATDSYPEDSNMTLLVFLLDARLLLVVGIAVMHDSQAKEEHFLLYISRPLTYIL